MIIDQKERKRFLELGRIWWEDSNHIIPINIFLREEFKKFKFTLKCLPTKDVKNYMGPVVNMESSFQKRIKRKRVQLIRDIS